MGTAGQECSQPVLTSNPNPPRCEERLPWPPPLGGPADASGATGASPWQPCQASLSCFYSTSARPPSLANQPYILLVFQHQRKRVSQGFRDFHQTTQLEEEDAVIRMMSSCLIFLLPSGSNSSVSTGLFPSAKPGMSDFGDQVIIGQETKAKPFHSQWIHMKPGNEVRYDSKRRHWVYKEQYMRRHTDLL
ncbi:uncharacterized protein LOC124978867 isoform X2 [Sciurus carolinensis]|uniref:uncharacterized protein LOC124978867 isoform X2 n=1 Tax=Sciurus carolinensis TaxID=30640 RepID=UPI001FB4F9C3|nr:uncharacterized protein LOC124978867 isoform X2 [Sciurus carolinensis]